MRARTPSFIAEFPLRTTAADERALSVRLDAARQIYNAVLGEALCRLALVRESRDWQRARSMPKTIGMDDRGKPISNRERAALFKATLMRFGFTAASLQKFAEACRDRCWISRHLGSHDTQTTSLRAFRAVQQHAFGKRGRPGFKRHGELRSVEGKGDAVIRFRAEPVPVVHWSRLTLPLMLDPKDKRQWQAQALTCRTKYVRVLWRDLGSPSRWCCQLIQEGLPPQMRAVGKGIVGLDLGPSTIAAVSDGDATLETFCPGVVQPWREMRRVERAMDRSRRATNPDNYNGDGTVKKGPKRWVRSARYRRLQARRAHAERRLAAERKRAHGKMANRILGQGNIVKAEKLSYRAFQRSFGRSVKVRAPGMFIAALRYKAAPAGGRVEEFSPRKTVLSQYDHMTGEYVKKPLSQRWHHFGDGRTEPVQRDLYSAHLARFVEGDRLDACRAIEAWPGAEPLLRQAASRLNQPASGRGFALPHVLSGVGAGRPSKGAGAPHEAVDVVAQKARATESAGAHPRNPLA